ncbi:luciferase family protein [Miltoncostaea marina]|uniref:luciferase domain-containing protein n=1 Tax=Miltoncostaea marina TaxID=2843215 RepID=UPI001C3C5AE1|nr:luciferase family protein [Miltoncostaea marina]
MATTTTGRPAARITREVTAWPGVTAADGSRGELSFRVGGREIGHLHGDRVAHFAFPTAEWRRLFDAGRIDHHPVTPGRPGWAQRRIASEADVDDVIALMRRNYERALVRGLAGGEK